MIYGLVIALHVLVSVVLIGIILVQGGRGGMAETLGGSAAQSLFGGGANVVMTKVTAIGAGLFMVTCLTLALLSSHRGRSVIDQVPLTLPEALPTAPQGATHRTEAPASHAVPAPPTAPSPPRSTSAPSTSTPPASGPSETTSPPK